MSEGLVLATSMTRYKITLPYPHRDLGPNRARNIHWSRKSKLVREYREAAGWECETAIFEAWGCNPKHKALNSRATFYVKDKRKRDRDNLQAMLKPAFDGFQDSGLVEDDCGITHFPCEIKYDKENPRVEIELWV